MDTGQSKHRLLIVDGDPKSLRVLEVSLKKAGFGVTTASNSHQALSALAGAAPDLIISDTDLDGADGFDLCGQIKAKPEWAKIPFLFVSGRKSIEDKIRGLELGVDDYLTKPVYIKEIGIRVRTALQRAERERLESRRDTRTKFSGDLADIGVVDLVQTIDLNRKSGIIHIADREGRRGAVFFRDGRVIDSEVGRLAGPEAMYRLFSWSEGRFEVEFKPIRRRDIIELPTAALLMEGMRRLDEWTRLLETLPGLDKVVEVDYRVLADQLADLPDEVNGLLRLCDGSRSLLSVVDDSDYPDLEALTVASNLFNQHILYVREPGAHREAEPSGELARWLEEGHGFADRSAERASEKALPATTLIGFGANESASLGDMKANQEVRTFTGDFALPADAATASRSTPNEAAPQEVPASKNNTLRIPAPGPVLLADSGEPPAQTEVPPSAPALATAQPTTPEETPGATSETDPDFPLLPQVRPRKSGALTDTLRGIPVPPEQGPLPSAAEKTPHPGPAVDDASPYPPAAEPSRITTLEYGSGERHEAAASEPPGDAQRESDWDAWTQGTPQRRGPTQERQAAAPDESSNDALGTEPSQSSPQRPWDEGPPPNNPRIRATHLLSDRLQPARHRRLSPILFSVVLLLGAGLLVREIRKRGSEQIVQGEAPAAAKEPAPLADAGSGQAALAQPTALPDASPVLAVLPEAKPARRAKPVVETRQPVEGPTSTDSTGNTDALERCRKLGSSRRSKPNAILAACQAANQADGNATDVMVILAQVELDRGNAAEARSWAKKAVEIRPDLADAYVFLGGAEQEAGNASEAKAAYKKYLELAPNGRYARELRAVLDSM